MLTSFHGFMVSFSGVNTLFWPASGPIINTYISSSVSRDIALLLGIQRLKTRSWAGKLWAYWKKTRRSYLFCDFLFSPEAKQSGKEKRGRWRERVPWPPPGGWVQRGWKRRKRGKEEREIKGEKRSKGRRERKGNTKKDAVKRGKTSRSKRK